MYADQAAKSAAPTPREATLNERLNKVHEGIQFQCERLESVLGRVNGTPQRDIKGGPAEVARIHPTHPLAGITEMLEQAHQRLADLTTNAEKIA